VAFGVGLVALLLDGYVEDYGMAAVESIATAAVALTGAAIATAAGWFLALRRHGRREASRPLRLLPPSQPVGRVPAVSELEIDETRLGESLRDAVAGIDPSSPDAPRQIWQGFLKHARQPLAYGNRYARDPDNDQLRFEYRQGDSGVSLNVERTVGVVLDEDYEGTIMVRCRMALERNKAWSALEAHEGIEGHGPTKDGGVQQFRDDVEASPAFAAFTESRIVSFRPVAHFG
jgi:hypothetical protein